MAVITQLWSAAGGSKYWLSPSKAFVFSHKGLMSHFFLFLSLQTYICMSLYQSLVWTSGQVFSHGEAVSKYNMNEKYPWNYLLPTAWHNLSLKPDGMCFTQGALAEEFDKKKHPNDCGCLLAMWDFVSTLDGRTPEFWSQLFLSAQTTSFDCWSSLFA